MWKINVKYENGLVIGKQNFQSAEPAIGDLIIK